MKKLLFILITFSTLTFTSNAQCNISMDWAQSDISPAPITSNDVILYHWFHVNSGAHSDLSDPVILKFRLNNLTLTNGPSSLYGPASSLFDWQYDTSTLIITGIQNQLIDMNSATLIQIAATVTSFVPCPNNMIGSLDTIKLPICAPPPPIPIESAVFTCYFAGAGCNLGTITTTKNNLTVDFGFSNPDTSSIIWDFGDGNTGVGQNPVHTYSQAGNYTVTATSSESPGPCIYIAHVNFLICDVTPVVVNSLSCPGASDGTITASASGTSPYIWNWSSGQTDPTIANLPAGTYTVTVTDAVNCQSVASVTLSDPMLTASSYNLTTTFDIDPPLSPGTTYNWDLGDGNTSTSPPPLTHTYTQAGTYNINLTTTNTAQATCNFQTTETVLANCLDTTVIDLSINCSTQYNPVCGCDSISYLNACNAETYNGVVSYTTGHCSATCPAFITSNVNNLLALFDLAGHQNGIQYIYWSFGDGEFSTSVSPTHNYSFPGIYNVSVIVLDTLLNQCTYYSNPSIGTGQLCIDATLIDLGAYCPGGSPVCGCNNVTYPNACIAENCFGVSSMTFGPCPISTDSSCTVTSSFTYTDTQTPNGHQVSFFGAGTGSGTLDYYWDFGDGSTAIGINSTHTYSDTTSQDSLKAFNICLAVVENAQCAASYCETIVLVVNPNGNIAGGVYEASNITSTGGVSTGKTGNGDPIPNVTVHLERADGLIITSDITDSLGLYSFDQLQFSDYRIRIDMPGIIHNGEPVELTPVVQQIQNLEFEVDDDGNVSTEVESVDWLSGIRVQPNPVNTKVVLEFSAPDDLEAELSLLSVTGETVYHQQLTVQKGMQTQELDLSDLVVGVYFVVLQSKNGVITKKLVKH